MSSKNSVARSSVRVALAMCHSPVMSYEAALSLLQLSQKQVKTCACDCECNCIRFAFMAPDRLAIRNHGCPPNNEKTLWLCMVAAVRHVKYNIDEEVCVIHSRKVVAHTDGDTIFRNNNYSKAFPHGSEIPNSVDPYFTIMLIPKK